MSGPDCNGPEPRNRPGAARTWQAPRVASGVFVAVEGGEGAGKSVLVAGLTAWARDRGVRVLTTREPGGTPLGTRLRGLLLDPATSGLDPRAEALLYAADRAEHAASVLRPALEQGALVLCDRYIDSSVAYQGVARGLGPADIAGLSHWGTGGLVPDLTIVLDVAPEVGLARAAARAGSAPDRLEAEPAAFHALVRRGFLDLAAEHPERYLVLDATRDPAALLADASARVGGLLPGQR
jgi:dTMP kinase